MPSADVPTVLVRVFDALRSRTALRSATRVGSGVRVLGRPRVANEGELVIGNGVTFVATPAPIVILVARGGSVVIGERVLIESGATIRARGRVSIGGGARVGAGCIIDDDGPGSPEISVGEGAWMEDRSLLLQGGRLAPGAVLEPASRTTPSGVDATPSTSNADSKGLEVEVDKRVRAVLGRVVNGASSVDRATNLTQVKGWDSLAALRVLVALEKEFAVVLPHQLFAQNPSLESVTPVILASVARHTASV